MDEPNPADRDEISAVEDEKAGARDDRADARDDRADARDDRADARDRAAGTVDAEAASDRAAALRDRQAAASDRESGAADRETASSDRVVSAEERAHSSIDGLTGAHSRDAGLVELVRETARAKRAGQAYVIAFVDVDGLKATNDTRGHASGDDLLHRVADTIRAHVRAYDLIVRFGGDEFVCGFPDLNVEDATKRLELVNADLAAIGASVSFGLAELNAVDTLAELIARADAALYDHRENPPSVIV